MVPSALRMQLTEQEVASTLDLLTSSRDRLKGILDSLSAAQWHAQPEPEAWSPAQIVAHLTTSEQLILDRVESLLAGPESPAELLAKTEGQEARLLRHVPNRTRRATAPMDMVPQAVAATPAEGFASFDAARGRAITFLSRPGLKERALPHFALGALTGYQWLIMVGVHSIRHAAQIEEQLS